MEEQIIDIAINSFTPVMEAAAILAGEYCKACGRTTMTGMDMQYALRYSARNVTGRTQGSMFPELEDESDEEDDECDIEEVDEEDEPFTRYHGADTQMVAINECYDTWHTWAPASPMEQMIKSSIDRISEE
tara:strand:- start:967 stop:1359 length:393 start_codon:yes stop_codon:yes gene_type:complete